MESKLIRAQELIVEELMEHGAQLHRNFGEVAARPEKNTLYGLRYYAGRVSKLASLAIALENMNYPGGRR